MPLQADLDGDGIVTADEMALALKLDHEGDGVIDVDLDLDGDGYSDVLVGAPENDMGGNAAGAARLFPFIRLSGSPP